MNQGNSRAFSCICKTQPTKNKNNKTIQNKRSTTQQKTINIKKNGRVVKTINVRRKSRYFSGTNRLIFLKNADLYFILNYYKNILNGVHVQILFFLIILILK